MDAKITLSFDAQVINKAKKFADENNISLSRLTEFLLAKVTSSSYKNIDSLPVSDWIAIVAEGKAQYKTKSASRKALKNDYFNSKK